MQRAKAIAAHHRCLGIFSRSPCARIGQSDNGIELRVDARDDIQMRIQHLDGADRPARNQRREFDGGFAREFVSHAVSHSSSRASDQGR
ncbi:hypothetical protein AB7828_24045 [Tardiphaga sp. 215_C5_N2_1]|uniref:hypothetical protein n=1 Tax=Tardiphaga sp. 215_C5_N2_1 TaxID=3240774 RepID=UPI003F88EFE7